MKLFLDDVRKPYDVFRTTINPVYENDKEWVIVRDYFQFIDFIRKFGLPKLISFDHDLSYEHYLPENQVDINYEDVTEKTGYDCAKWLVGFCEVNELGLPNFLVHSANPEGKRNIEEYLNSFV
jgi:hypothetical protein